MISIGIGAIIIWLSGLILGHDVAIHRTTGSGLFTTFICVVVAIILGIVWLSHGIECLEKEAAEKCIDSIRVADSKIIPAIEVYRGNTSLLITYNDTIPMDSAVVYKDSIKGYQ